MHHPTPLIIAGVALAATTTLLPATHAQAAASGGENWPHPGTIVGECNWTSHVNKYGFFWRDQHRDIPRRNWMCSRYEITFAVMRYPSAAAAATEGIRFMEDFHIDLINYDLYCDDPVDGECGVIRKRGDDAAVFSSMENVEWGTLTVTDVHPGLGMDVSAMAAWAHHGPYVALVHQVSDSYRAGYFKSHELVAAARALAASPPSGLPVVSADGGTGTGTPAGKPDRAAPPSARAVATETGKALRKLTQNSHRQYRQMRVPKRSTLRAATDLPGAQLKQLRFAGFKNRKTRVVWLRSGSICLKANARKPAAKWRIRPCPATATWRAPR